MKINAFLKFGNKREMQKMNELSQGETCRSEPQLFWLSDNTWYTTYNTFIEEDGQRLGLFSRGFVRTGQFMSWESGGCFLRWLSTQGGRWFTLDHNSHRRQIPRHKSYIIHKYTYMCMKVHVLHLAFFIPVAQIKEYKENYKYLFLLTNDLF